MYREKGDSSAGFTIQVRASPASTDSLVQYRLASHDAAIFAGKTWFHSTRHGRTVHARQFHVCPYLCSCISTSSSSSSSRWTLCPYWSVSLQEPPASTGSQAARNSELITLRRRLLRITASCFLLPRLSPTLSSDIPARRLSGTH